MNTEETNKEQILTMINGRIAKEVNNIKTLFPLKWSKLIKTIDL